MRTTAFATAIVLLALLGATAPLTGTQAAEIGEGIEIVVSDGPNGQYATVGPDGQVRIDMTAANSPAGGGEGVLADAFTNFDDTFVVVNTNDRRAFVYVRDETESLQFYRSDNQDASLEGEGNEVRLDSGEELPVGLTVDATDRTEDIDATFTVVARVSELATAVLDIEPRPIPAGEPAVFNASGSTGDALAYDYRFDDGVTRTDAGSQIERTFTEPGTYTVNLSVAETTGASDDDSASVVQEFVVIGAEARETLDDGRQVTLTAPDQNTAGTIPSRSITFDQSITGSVTSSTVAVESIGDITGDTTTGDPIAATEITVPTDQDDVSATIQLTIDRDALGTTDPANLVVERYNDDAGRWETLETTVDSTSSNTIVLESETPGFSLFAVTAQDDGTNAGADDDDDRVSGSGGGGGGGGGGGTLSSTLRISELNLSTTEVASGEPITVSATVASDRAVTATTPVELRVNGETVATQTVSIGTDASRTVEFSDVRLSDVDPGQYTIGVYAGGDSQTATVTVTQAPADADADTTAGADDADTTAGADDAGEEEPAATEPESADRDSPDTTEDGTPGFGVVLVITALIAFLVLARHRSRRGR